MEKRPYNIFFDLHTVSGIVISVLAYVIFFAGSFSFFRDQIINWERNEPVTVRGKIDLDVDVALDTLSKKVALYSRDISIYRSSDERRVNISISESKDSLLAADKRAGDFLYLNPTNFQQFDYYTSYTLGEFLYRLHFFAQIPYPAGYYLSGFTALFLLFAVITGILVHWKKIVSNFYVFRPKEKLKTIWTDAHTVLGTLGLPFHIVYSVTGAFFMINIVLITPGVMTLFDGDSDKLYAELGYEDAPYVFENKKLRSSLSVNGLISKGSNLWKDWDVTEIIISNYGDESMHVKIEGSLDPKVNFAGVGEVVYEVASGKVVHQKDPYAGTSYLDGVKVALYRIHYGDYGGTFLRVISFILGLFACLLVITGVLIWLEARNKKHVSEKKKQFNKWIAYIYLAVCLSMFPVTALTFIVVKFLPIEYAADEMTILYTVFFLTWLIASIALVWTRDNFSINKYTLISGAILSFCIPLSNGLVTGDWIWMTFVNEKQDLFVVDMLWLLIGIAAAYALFRMKGPKVLPTTDYPLKKAAILSQQRIVEEKS